MKDWQNKLGNTIKSLGVQSGLLSNATKLYDNISKLQNDLTNSYLSFEESKTKINEISQRLKEDLSNFKTQIQELYQDNKNFQKELDASLITRLDKYKSDIQIEVRNEGTQMQRSFETTLNSNFNSMESKLKEHFHVQSKQLNTLKILMFVVIGIGIGLAISFYLK